MNAIPAAWFDLDATHGNVARWVGPCPTCCRDAVFLTDRGTCANGFACAAAWSRLPKRDRRFGRALWWNAPDQPTPAGDPT